MADDKDNKYKPYLKVEFSRLDIEYAMAYGGYEATEENMDKFFNRDNEYDFDNFVDGLENMLNTILWDAITDRVNEKFHERGW